MTTEELQSWLKVICTSLGCCIGMFELDTGEAAGRPCTLCGDSTPTNGSSSLKRTLPVSFYFVSMLVFLMHKNS